MLNLIFGRKLSGKTKYCTDLAAKLANENKNVILLIPEQYSFECQKMLLCELGPVVSNKIEIHSFTSLCKAISTEIGGISGVEVDEGIRFLLVGRALENVKDNLKHYARYVNSNDFRLKIVSVINELKQASVNSEMLKKLSETAESSAFSDKLSDVALIMSAYDALLERKFIEPNDIINKTVLRMQGSSFFKGKTVILDEFKGFTESQLELLGRIISGCDDVYAAFCCDSAVPSGDTDLFKNVIASAESLKKTAEKNGIECAEPVILNYSGYKSDALKKFEKFSSQKDNGKYELEAKDLCVCRASSQYDEVDFVMNKIRTMVRENGYRYSDFVIVSRNSDTYSAIISDVSEKYEVPCLVDRRINSCELPLSIYAVSALRAAISLDTTDILRYLKTGFSGLSVNEISKLESYAFIWSINGKKWLQPWNLNPEGLKENKNSETFENVELNSLRERAIKPLTTLKKGLSGTVTDMCKAIFKLVSDDNTIFELKKYTNKLETEGRLDDAEHQRAGYDVLIKILDKLCAVSGDETVLADQFAEMLKTALSFETVGEIPRTKDQVIYGTADRIRPLRPKVCFVIGANHDVFPQSVGIPDIFSVSERALMEQNGIKISTFDISDSLDEKFLFYYYACCASDKIFISYSTVTSDGNELLPSEEVVDIVSAFPMCEKVSRGFVREFDLSQIESKASAFEKMASNLSYDEVSVALQECFREDEKYKDKLSALQNVSAFVEPMLSKQAARKLYGEHLKLSPSKIEDYNNCEFAFFCKFGLNAKKNEKVDFNAATRGNIVHFCLEHFVNNHKDDIGSLDEKDVYNEALKLCDEYLALVGVSTDDVGDKFNYLLGLLKKTAAYICVALNREFAQSQFKPKYCELKIGEEKQVSPLIFTADNGVKVSVEGTVDRVDTTNDGKIRVVDYKTGVKEFKLSQVLNGMNQQMLLYLYSLVENAKNLLKANIPTGVLYFPARKDMSDKGDGRYIKMNGLVTSDIDTIKQMEMTGEGKIVPAHVRSGGTSLYASESIVSPDGFDVIFKYLDKAVAEIGAKITNGSINRLPYKKAKSISCDYCDYKSVCRLNDETRYREEFKMKTADVLDNMSKYVKKEGE